MIMDYISYITIYSAISCGIILLLNWKIEFAWAFDIFLAIMFGLICVRPLETARDRHVQNNKK